MKVDRPVSDAKRPTRRAALGCVLSGFATDAVLNSLPNRNIIMFSERNSEALNASDNAEYGT
jgi:hypothetical protein